MIDSRSMESLYEHFSAQQQQQPIHHRGLEDAATLEKSKPSRMSREETVKPAVAAARSYRSFWFFWRTDVSR
ncbi:uncharacterized protein PG998_010802 [Apiospora kogelbergensis]|uniref:Uncharacterized protein n=1 Tax=Apiospora kogelbergensis TaxID=1337665 RepID=A0AAW0RDW0_9PEZI